MGNIAIISGGTATNSILDILQKLSDSHNSNNDITPKTNIKSKKRFTSHILPISDNGGSTSEIIRVLGGCSVGDIRSRITRLIPEESSALRDLLTHRLPKDPNDAKLEWGAIVEGSHPLWSKVDPPCKEIVRSFLIHVHMEILKRSRNSTKNFRLELASVGNLFLTGARLFCGSLDSAVELILRITRVSSEVQVLPCLNTNFTYHISALLKDGSIVTGQSQISHPSAPSATITANTQTFRKKRERKKQSEFIVRSDSLVHPPPITASGTTSPKRDSLLNTNNSILPPLTSSTTRSFNLEDEENDDTFSGSMHSKIDSQTVLYGTTEPSHSRSSSCKNPEIYANEFLDDHYSYSENESIIENDHQGHESDENENEYAVPAYIHPDLKVSQLHFNKDETTPLPAPIERIFYISPYGEEIYPLAQTRVLNCLTESDIIIYSIGSLMTSIVPVLILQGVGEAILNDSETTNKKKVLLLNGSLDRETECLDALGYIKTIYDSLRYSMLVNNSRKGSSANNDGPNTTKPTLSSFVTHLVHLEPSKNIRVDVEEIEGFGIKCLGVKAQDGFEDRYDSDELYNKLNMIANE